MKVLFIDSGIGGLTTLAECVKIMPNLNFIYFADDKFSPYGNLLDRQIYERVSSIIAELLKQDVGLVVLACNTATATAIDKLRKHFEIPIVGTEPAIKPTSQKGNKVLVLATPATSRNKRLFKLMFGAPCPIEIAPMPNLAHQIDQFFLFGDTLCEAEIEQTIDYICALSKNKTHIVLGCTHYVHLKPQIEARTRLVVTDGNNGVAKQVNRLASPLFFSKKPTQKFMLSSKNKMLAKKYRKIFDQTLANITKL